MRLGANGDGGAGGMETIMPSGPELLFGALLFGLLLAAMAVIVLLLVKRVSSSRVDELEQWRERALRAEAQRDLLRERSTDASNDADR